MNPSPKPDPDQAVARRLAKLGQRQPDTRRLEQSLEASLAGVKPAQPLLVLSWLRPAAGLAAVLLIALTLFFTVSPGPPTASAAVLELSQLHQKVETGAVVMQAAASIEAVNRTIAAQRGGEEPLPEAVRGSRVQSCCLVDVQGELVALAILRDGGPPVSLIVAQAEDFAHEMGTVIEIDGRRFFGHVFNGIPMMMANDGDRWLCVMGDRSNQELAEIEAAVNF